MGSAPLQYLSHILHFQCSLASGKRKCRKYFLDFEHRSICRCHCSTSSVFEAGGSVFPSFQRVCKEETASPDL